MNKQRGIMDEMSNDSIICNSLADVTTRLLSTNNLSDLMVILCNKYMSITSERSNK